MTFTGTTLREEYMNAASGDVSLAAALLAKGLMQGDEATCKAGYERDTALSSVSVIFPRVDTGRVAEILAVIEP